MIDYARAKAKRDLCLFFRADALAKKQVCEKIGYRRPFLATCYSCKYYSYSIPITKIVPRRLPEKKICSACGALLPNGNPALKRCPTTCKNSLLAYFPRKRIVIEEIQNEEDLYGVSLT